MYPEEYNYRPTNQPTRRFNPRILIVAGIVAVVVIIALAIWASLGGNKAPSNANIEDPGYVVHETGLTSDQSFSAVQGNELFSYNGLVFYKQPLSGTKNVTVLSSGIKLPQVARMQWAGSKGAAVQFKGSYVGTAVYDTLLAQRISSDSSTLQNYWWYVDFSKGTVSILTKRALNPSPKFSTAANGLYYFAPDQTSEAFKRLLLFYDVATGQTKNIGSSVDIAQVNDMTICKSGQLLCVIGRDSSQDKTFKLYSFNASTGSEKTLLTEVTGNIVVSNDPDLFASVPAGENESKGYADPRQDEGANEDTDPAPSQVSVFDVNTKQSYSLNFQASVDTTALPYFTKQGNFAWFSGAINSNSDDGSNLENFEPGFRAGVNALSGEARSNLFKLVKADGQKVSKSMIALSAGEGPALLTDTGGDQYIFTTSTESPVASKQSEKPATDAVVSCLAAAGQGSEQEFNKEQSTFSIFITYDNTFTTRTRAFADCVASKGTVGLIGYNYQLVGVDPKNGRIVTD